ncbi:hypothetical protein LCGC14_0298150 [marine sediment metagenome]|uniref:Uncharacterized protein n=1 Tax=marine sediment metagenome TaxID=412755 RepID=A0A0F9WCL8_9ZZZZ
MTEQITMDEWLAEMDKIHADDEGLTGPEIAKISGRSESTTFRMLFKGLTAGRYTKGYATRTNSRGALRRVSVYRVVSGDEWQQELEKWSGGDDGLTTREIAKMLGCSIRPAYHMIHKGIAAGRYTEGYALRADRINRQLRVPVYRLVSGDEWQVEVDKWFKEDQGLTAVEIAKASGHAKNTMRRLINRGVAAGKYIKGFAYRRDKRGTKIHVPVYRVVK